MGPGVKRASVTRSRGGRGCRGSQTSQTQLGRSLVLDSGSGRGVRCVPAQCDIRFPAEYPGPQFPHLSDDGTLEDHRSLGS